MKNIYRHTLRADGLTVGEAMDQDAADLRRLGIPAKDGQPTIDERRENFREQMRLGVLASMDLTAASLREDGPKDADLPALFPAIDKIADRIFNKSAGF